MSSPARNSTISEALFKLSLAKTRVKLWIKAACSAEPNRTATARRSCGRYGPSRSLPAFSTTSAASDPTSPAAWSLTSVSSLSMMINTTSRPPLPSSLCHSNSCLWSCEITFLTAVVADLSNSSSVAPRRMRLSFWHGSLNEPRRKRLRTMLSEDRKEISSKIREVILLC